MRSTPIAKTARMLFPLVFTAVTWLYQTTDATATTANSQVVCNTVVVVSRTNEIKTEGQKLIINDDARKWVQFRDLRKEWLAKRGASSSLADMSMLEPYQRIIGMGDSAIPLILAQLKREGDEPDQWFWALRILSGENPVKPEDQGDFRAMARTWINWGIEKELAGYGG